MKKVKYAVVFCLLSLLSVAQQTINYSITVDTIQRDFILYIPASYSANTAAPLVFSYHGLGGNAQRQMDEHDFRPVADTAGFIVAHPEGAPTVGPGIQSWNFGNDTLPDDVLFTNAMIDTIAADYNVDLNRVYACGMSFGGYFSIFLAGQLSNRIASVASVAGTKLSALPDSMITPARPMSLLQIHGTDDFNVPYNGNQISVSVQEVLNLFVTHNNCDTVPSVTQLPDTDPNDGSTVEQLVYAQGDNGTVVEHLKVDGGAHTWPDENTSARGVNRDINGCEEIWRFFARYDINGALGLSSEGELEPQNSEISIYPNPAGDFVVIHSSQSLQQVRVFSALGQEHLKLTNLAQQKMNIYVGELSAGIYYITGRSEAGSFRSTFIKL